jgi:tRNA A37 threonylcarbamoyladenosine dehydratase
MTTNSIPSIFNNHFSDFLNDIQNVFPNDIDIAKAKNTVATVRKANPKLLIKFWRAYVAEPYASQIEQNNIEFFITKDYSQDLSKNDNSSHIMDIIDRLREPVKLMSKENQIKTMKYIQNLSKLSLGYND